MFNLMKKAFTLLLLGFVGTAIVHTSTSDRFDFHDDPDLFYNYIEDQKLNSSRFSQVEDLRQIDPATIIAINDDDALITENDDFRLFLNIDTLNFKIENKQTGYVWSTALDDPINAGSYDPLLRSGIGIEYINKEQQMGIRENVGIINTEFEVTQETITDGVRLHIDIGGFCATTSCRLRYDDYLAGDFTLEQLIRIGFVQIGVAFTLDVRLTDSGISAHIPYDSISEEGTDWITLSSIIMFPGMGAAFLDEIPGYMVVPDGVGTLMRYDDNKGQFSTPFEERFYGSNAGIATGRVSVTSHPLSMPIFGAVHGVRQNAFIGIIESGDLNARLLAHPNGSRNLDYNLIFTKFDLKQTFRQSFSSDGTGGAMRVAETSHDDIRIRFDFLDGQDAHYTGIAKQYRNYLIDQGVLRSLESSSDRIPIHIQFLMADSTSRFFGKSLIEMTSIEAARDIYDDLHAAGLENQTVSLLGWNRGGYSGRLPSAVNFESRLGSSRAYEAFIDHINTSSNQVYLVNNYVHASNDTGRITYRNDVAAGVDRFKMDRTRPNRVYPNRYTLLPSTSNRLALRDLSDYEDLGVKVLHESLASTLFSYYERDIYTRTDTFRAFEDIYQAYDEQAGYYYPNAYAYKYTDTFFHMPLYNSQLKYFDDLIPLLPIVLRGHMELYSEFLNYNSLGREQLLALIDFGINPSFILSENRASNLRGSDIEYYYTSRYDEWRNSVIEDYLFVNDALQHVIGHTIINRQVLDVGIVEVTYDNGVYFVINYTSQTYTLPDDVSVAPLDVHIGGVGS